MSLDTRWYAFEIQPLRPIADVPEAEFTIVRILKRRGFLGHVPARTKHHRRRRQRKGTTWRVPILTTYVLMEFESEPPWHQLFAMSVIKGVLGEFECPHLIPRAQIEHIFAMANSKVPVKSLNKSFGPGDDVSVKSGPFMDWHGKVHSVRGERVRLLLGLNEKPIELPIGQLEAA